MGRRAWLRALPALLGLDGLGSAAAHAALPKPARAGGPGEPERAGEGLGNSDTAEVAPAADDDAVRAGRALRFPRDHGAHPGARIEWWYATGWLHAPGTPPSQPSHGFQVTFFRSRIGAAALAAGGAGAGAGMALAAGSGGRFAPRQLLFAHAAITDLAARRHVHAQRVARWSGDETLPEAHAQRSDTGVRLGAWQFSRTAAAGAGAGAGASAGTGAAPDGNMEYQAHLPAPEAGLNLSLRLRPTQPLLLQGDAGYSRKGPLPQQASHYYSMPQLAVQASVTLAGQRLQLAGTGWLDHEWSNELLAPGAVGWDWIGFNLFGGGALTAFVLRRADGSAVWAGGSFRSAGGALQVFAADAVRWAPGRRWRSPQSGAEYPVAWTVDTPAGRFEVDALLDAQELDSRMSTGAVYWEGLAELRRPGGERLGLGYLEMTGRSAPLRLL